ncbi:hypothetical protein HZH66_002231 [Vespula vulgaris]|uniref:Uncharacterized protein n=2 Tax=Vespula TaxID=7451 RepID=A0A834PAL5_VESPE|nr:hypothetical protein HZH66_002231 [Vespula vulgaris]KAF7434561.1 hypothetical protein H0235_002752 [Vespula pensylvanica]
MTPSGLDVGDLQRKKFACPGTGINQRSIERPRKRRKDISGRVEGKGGRITTGCEFSARRRNHCENWFTRKTVPQADL